MYMFRLYIIVTAVLLLVQLIRLPAQSLLNKSEKYIINYVGENNITRDSAAISFTMSDINVTCFFNQDKLCNKYHMIYPLDQYDNILYNFNHNYIINGLYWISGNHQLKYTVIKTELNTIVIVEENK